MALGNLYATVRVEEERAERLRKLLRRKELALRAREKRKARQLGIDPEALDGAPPAEQ